MVNQYSKYPQLRFCKVNRRTKKPFELDWVNKPYTWDQIQEHISKEINFGILCGYGDLIVIDCDKEKLANSIEENLPATFTVQTGGGGKHFYFFCPLEKKIILTTTEHWGEVQSKGTQVVGAGSIHPNEKAYTVLKDISIASINLEDLMVGIKDFMKIEVHEIEAIAENKKVFGEDINDQIGMSLVFPLAGFKKSRNGELFGANPWHGSDTGMNTWVNISKNVAHCFRCDCGLSVAKVIALNEGIIKNCADPLRGSSFVKVLDIAKEKYGYKNSRGIEIVRPASSQVYSWSDLQDIDSFVIYEGKEDIYEIHFKGQVISLGQSSIDDYKPFRRIFFKKFGVMLPAYKGISTDWALLLTHWRQNFGVIRKEKREDISDQQEAKDLLVGYIENSTIATDYVVSEGLITLKENVIYLPLKIIRRILRRNNLNVSIRLLAYEMDDLLVGGSIPLKVGKQSERFWRLAADKFDLTGNSYVEVDE